MKKIIIWLCIFSAGFLIGAVMTQNSLDNQIREIEEAALESCNRRLAEPHHCVSFIVENLDKICGDCYAE